MGDNSVTDNAAELMKRRKQARAKLKAKAAEKSAKSYNSSEGDGLRSGSMIQVDDKASSSSVDRRCYRLTNSEPESLPEIRPKSKRVMEQEDKLAQLKALNNRPVSRIAYDINYKLSDFDEEAEEKRVEEAARQKQEEETRRRIMEEERIKNEEMRAKLAMEVRTLILIVF